MFLFFWRTSHSVQYFFRKPTNLLLKRFPDEKFHFSPYFCYASKHAFRSDNQTFLMYLSLARQREDMWPGFVKNCALLSRHSALIDEALFKVRFYSVCSSFFCVRMLVKNIPFFSFFPWDEWCAPLRRLWFYSCAISSQSLFSSFTHIFFSSTWFQVLC